MLTCTHPVRFYFKRSEGTVVLAKILGPSGRGAEYRLTSVDSSLPSNVEEDSASDTEIVWAKSACGVWGLANVFANGKLYFTRDVPEPENLPQGLETPAKPAAKPAPKAAKPGPKRSAAKAAAKPAAKPAAGELIPVAPVEHVQLFKVKYSHQRKWYTEPVAE